MEAGTVFKMRDRVFEARKRDGSCMGCAGAFNERLCKRLPDCNAYQLIFRSVGEGEVKDMKRQGVKIETL